MEISFSLFHTLNVGFLTILRQNYLNGFIRAILGAENIKECPH